MLITGEAIGGGMYKSPIFSEYFHNMKIVVADIETTGLSPKNSIVMLCGAVAEHRGGRRAGQIFAANASEEKELLEIYSDWLSKFDAVITYNGQSFDLPFIKKRMYYHGMNTSKLDRLYSMDLYRIVKYYSFLPDILPDLKQKSVESYLGDSNERTDKIDGAENIRLYDIYQKAKGEERENALSEILLHNRDDIVRLSDILRILQNLDLHEIMYGEGFPVKIDEMLLNVGKTKIRSNRILVSGSIYGIKNSLHLFDDGMELDIDAKRHSFSMKLECRVSEGIVFADAESWKMDPSTFDKTDGWGSGYLVLRDAKGIRHHESNLLIKALLTSLLG